MTGQPAGDLVQHAGWDALTGEPAKGPLVDVGGDERAGDCHRCTGIWWWIAGPCEMGGAWWWISKASSSRTVFMSKPPFVVNNMERSLAHET